MYCAYYNSDFLIGKQCDKSRQYVSINHNLNKFHVLKSIQENVTKSTDINKKYTNTNKKDELDERQTNRYTNTQTTIE